MIVQSNNTIAYDLFTVQKQTQNNIQSPAIESMLKNSSDTRCLPESMRNNQHTIYLPYSPQSTSDCRSQTFLNKYRKNKKQHKSSKPQNEQTNNIENIERQVNSKIQNKNTYSPACRKKVLYSFVSKCDKLQKNIDGISSTDVIVQEDNNYYSERSQELKNQDLSRLNDVNDISFRNKRQKLNEYYDYLNNQCDVYKNKNGEKEKKYIAKSMFYQAGQKYRQIFDQYSPKMLKIASIDSRPINLNQQLEVCVKQKMAKLAKTRQIGKTWRQDSFTKTKNGHSFHKTSKKTQFFRFNNSTIQDSLGGRSIRKQSIKQSKRTYNTVNKRIHAHRDKRFNIFNNPAISMSLQHKHLEYLDSTTEQKINSHKADIAKTKKKSINDFNIMLKPLIMTQKSEEINPQVIVKSKGYSIRQSKKIILHPKFKTQPVQADSSI